MPRGAKLAVVDRIVDGDTLELHARAPGPVFRSTADTDVRLLEIDTPETVHPSEPVECYGPAASQRSHGWLPTLDSVGVARLRAA